MKVGIMQPYFMPYIGYFQLINAVDKFVIYDNIQYSKRGWINRNRILVNGKDEFITLPLKKDSDYLNVVDRQLSDNAMLELKKIVRKIEEVYRKAPFFELRFPLVKEILENNECNLFQFLLQSLKAVLQELDIKTEIVVSSQININHSLKGKEKVLALCQALETKTYINPIGGLELYNREQFNARGIKLQFIKSDKVAYNQFGNDYIPWLSIIDVMMFNNNEKIKMFLDKKYDLI